MPAPVHLFIPCAVLGALLAVTACNTRHHSANEPAGGGTAPPPPTTPGGCVARAQFVNLPTKCYLPADTDDSTAIVELDFDADGDLDLVVGNNGQNRLYENDGDGRFTNVTETRFPADSDMTTGLAAGDVDLDGDLDILVGNTDRDRLYLNDGAGTFTEAPLALPQHPDFTQAVILVDVDADADLDAILATAGQDRLYLNDGTGGFLDVTSERLPTRMGLTNAVAAGDVDGDGDLDLVLATGVPNATPEQTLLYENDGSGTFADVTNGRLPARPNVTRSIALGDVDADGDLDIVLGNDQYVVINFLTGWQNELYLNDGTGTFTDGPRLPQEETRTASLALADVDGDGDLDILNGNEGMQGKVGAQKRLYLNDGAGNYTYIASGALPVDQEVTLGVLLIDVDGDLDLDAVLANGALGSRNRLYLNDGSGIFTDATAARLPGGAQFPTALALGDIDGDRDLDIVLGSVTQPSLLFVNDGAGAFTDQTASRMPAVFDVTRALALGDVDADGDLDIVLGTASFQRNRLYVNDGSGVFADDTMARMPPRSYFTRSLALGDVDADGDLDIVLGNGTDSSGQRADLYRNDGNGTFAADPTAMPLLASITGSVVLGDVDADGDLDIVLGNGATGLGEQNNLYLNDGAGMFTDVTATHMPIETEITHAIALADIDGDGDLDIVAGNRGPGQNRAYQNDGNGVFSELSGALPTALDDTWAAALVDVDEDGDADLVTGNRALTTPQANRIYLNDGTGLFADASATRMTGYTDSVTALAVGDVDGDRDPDLVFGNTQRNRLLTNQHRQIAAPIFPTLGRSHLIEIFAQPGYAGTDHTATPVLSLGLAPAPIALPPLGSFYLDPTTIIRLPVLTIPAEDGSAVLRIPIPPTPALVGLGLYVQALVADPANLAGAGLTGYTADTIGS